MTEDPFDNARLVRQEGMIHEQRIEIVRKDLALDELREQVEKLEREAVESYKALKATNNVAQEQWETIEKLRNEVQVVVQKKPNSEVVLSYHVALRDKQEEITRLEAARATAATDTAVRIRKIKLLERKLEEEEICVAKRGELIGKHYDELRRMDTKLEEHQATIQNATLELSRSAAEEREYQRTIRILERKLMDARSIALPRTKAEDLIHDHEGVLEQIGNLAREALA